MHILKVLQASNYINGQVWATYRGAGVNHYSHAFEMLVKRVVQIHIGLSSSNN